MVVKTEQINFGCYNCKLYFSCYIYVVSFPFFFFEKRKSQKKGLNVQYYLNISKIVLIICAVVEQEDGLKLCKKKYSLASCEIKIVCSCLDYEVM